MEKRKPPAKTFNESPQKVLEEVKEPLKKLNRPPKAPALHI